MFITTSHFSRDAKETAQQFRTGSVVLVDGRRLAELMMDHGIGVTHKTLLVPRIDGDYFEA